MFSQNNNKSLGNPNAGVTMPESVVLPEILQEKIDDFFGLLGELPELEERAWTFLETAANGAYDVNLDGRHISDWMFMYRRCYELIKFLHSFKTQKVINN